jgi:triacylglycerol lipase
MHFIPVKLVGTLSSIALLALAGCAASPRTIEQPPPVKAGECVVLLHGLARSSDSMETLEGTLTAAGYSVVNIDYESRSGSIEALAIPTINAGLNACRANNATTIHFVAHSLGGILLRYYLTEQPIPELGRCVMLAPPNQGSEAVDAFRGWPGFSSIFGPAGSQLGTDADSLPRQLGPVGFDVGIIAANRSLDPFSSMALPNPDDGKVSVASTRVEGMNDFLVVPHTHTYMMKAEIVQQQVLYYLQHGRFDHQGVTPTTQ